MLHASNPSLLSKSTSTLASVPDSQVSQLCILRNGRFELSGCGASQHAAPRPEGCRLICLTCYDSTCFWSTQPFLDFTCRGLLWVQAAEWAKGLTIAAGTAMSAKTVPVSCWLRRTRHLLRGLPEPRAVAVCSTWHLGNDQRSGPDEQNVDYH